MASEYGLSHLQDRLLRILTRVMSNGGNGEFTMVYEPAKQGKFWICLRGTESHSFYSTREDLHKYTYPESSCNSLHELVRAVMRTAISAVFNSGYGEFKVKYKRSDDETNRAFICGTERHEFVVKPDDVKAMRVLLKMEKTV